MRVTARSYVCVAILNAFAGVGGVDAQNLPAAASSGSSCAGLLADESRPATADRAAPTPTDTLAQRDTSAARRSTGVRGDTASASIGGATTGDPDIILRAAVQANEVRFAAQPRVRVRLCWGGDTLRVVQRENLPSPVVAGTTYRNVYVAVELLGRLNAECLVDRISGTRNPASRAPSDTVGGVGACTFLGASAATGRQPSQPPRP